MVKKDTFQRGVKNILKLPDKFRLQSNHINGDDKKLEDIKNNEVKTKYQLEVQYRWELWQRFQLCS